MNMRERQNRFAIGRRRQIGYDAARSVRSTPTATAQQLLDLADQISRVLVPVQADANYRRRLKGELILAAQQRESNLPLRRRTALLVGAAAIGSLASVAGVIIAFVLRYRHGHTQPSSPSL